MPVVNGPTAYVRARAAAADGAVEIAALGYGQALAAAPDDAVIALRAYREALAAGDYSLARRAATVLRTAKVAPPDTAILAMADALKAEDWKAADTALAQMKGGPLEFLTPVLGAWIAYEREQDPIPLLDASSGTSIARRYGAEHRGLLLIASNQFDEGGLALQPLLAMADSRDVRINAALLLARKRHKGEAAELVGGDPVKTRSQIGNGVKASAAFGASRLFTRVADDLKTQDTQTLSILLTRAALLLDSSNDQARLLLASALSRTGAEQSALVVLAGVTRAGPYGRDALQASVGVYSAAEQPAAALAVAQRFSEASGATAQDIQSYADLLMAREDYIKAIEVYRRALAQPGGDADWVLHVQLGGALERVGKWDEALPLLRKAVQIAPQQPAALNYLGYALADRGESLAEAEDLLVRARKLAPDSAAIQDSLAWTYVQQGQVKKALPLLEGAAKAEPGDPEINEHLGDVYWRSGRRFEARYAWRAAAVYAEDDAKTRLSGKIQSGLRLAKN